MVDFSFAEKNIVPKSYNAGGMVKSTVTPAEKRRTIPPVSKN